MIIPVFRTCLNDVSAFVEIGITEEVYSFEVPLSGDVPNDGGDDISLLTHLGQSLEHMKQLYTFSLIPGMWPWRWVKLLSPDRNVQDECLAEARKTWQMLLRIGPRAKPHHADIKKLLPITHMAIFREPFNILQAAGYVKSQKLAGYAEGMHSHLLSSSSLEARLF